MFDIKTNIPTHKAVIKNDIKISESNRIEFAPATIHLIDGNYEASIINNGQSYMINKLNQAMVVIDKKQIKKGDLVDVIILNDLLKI